MSESRSSESRVIPSYQVYGSSESRSSESRQGSFVPLYQTVERVSINQNQPNYNNLASIDELIERLEKDLPTKKDASISPKVNAAYEERRRKLEELRKLQQEAREEQLRQQRIKTAEEKLLPGIEAGNRELDNAIEQVKQMVKKPQPKSTYQSYSGYYDGESRNGESRW